MRIAFVSNVVYPFVTGGAQKRIYEIGTRLVERGHDVTVYGRHYWDGPEEMEYEGMTLRAVSPARELYSGDRRSITEAVEFGKDVVGPLRRHGGEHDLVVASVFPYFPVLLSKVGTLFQDVPLVTTWHEVWDSYWDDYLGSLAPFGKLVERATSRIPQQPVAVSGVTAEQLVRIGPARDEIEVVPNGIDVDRIRSVTPATDGFDVLYAGRLIDDKNVDLALEAFDRVADSHDATMGVIGDGPQYDPLQEHAASLEHSDRVSFLGFLDEYEDVLAQMRTADVFCQPSTREGFGITVAEAMAADCSVITAHHPRNAAIEVVGDAGFCVSPDTYALTEQLNDALAGERPAQSPVERASEYDWDRIAEEAETVYQQAVHQPAQRSVTN